MKKTLLSFLLFFGVLTTVSAQQCGSVFSDPGGETGNYANNTDSTVTICPQNTGDVVTVTFTTFATEVNWDALYVFNGSSISAPQITSTNGAGNVPGGLAGGFWGTVIPGPFTSTSPDGCLTFRFRSDSSTVSQGWTANVTCGPRPTCSLPVSLVTSGITSSSISLNWTQPLNPDSSVATNWDIISLPCGSPAPTATSSNYTTITNLPPYTVTALSPETCYTIYIRSRCSGTDFSNWTAFSSFTTLPAPPVCGGQFVDNGGSTANYLNNSDTTTTICPTNTGDVVTVTFSSFNTEANWDALYVFDGQSISAPQISSTNAAGNVPGGLAGGFWGTTIPGPFTSTSSDGCLTFRFRSDNTANRAGWIANISCAPPPSCRVPTGITTSNITPTTATVNWTQPLNPDNSTANQWELFLTVAGSPSPSQTATPTGVTNNNTFILNGLLPYTCYTVYVRAVCSVANTSFWSTGSNFCTPIAPPVCGGQFVDNGGPSANYTNNSDNTYTICPTNPGEIVSVIFNSFDTEATYDALYVFNGNSISSPQIASSNPAANVPGGLPGGFWGTTIPGPFVSTSPDGCLTFRFRSDNTANRAGWSANVNCTPDTDKILLVAFVDSNNNGIKDSGELFFTNGSFVYQQNNDGTTINGYSPIGQFALYDSNPANTYGFTYQIQPEYATYYSSGTTSYNNISIATGSGTQILYFPITLTQSYNDVAVSISPVTIPRPGLTYVNKIIYKNKGVNPASGTLTFVKPTQITTFTVSQTGVVNNASGFSYAFTNLQPNEIRSMDVTMTIPTVPVVNLNELLTDSASITASSDDITPENNSCSNSQIIVNAVDPNDKMESRGKTIPINQFAADDYFVYTIRFQNTGTANAIDVHIEDILNVKIDETSVLMVNSSHNYTMKRINNQLVWDFKNIYLSPQSTNDAGSKGYLQFKVRLKPGFQAGNIIPNSAAIYFDSNPAITTAIFNSKFTTPLGIADFNAGSFVLHPNPTRTNVHVALMNTYEKISKVVLYDILGKTVKTVFATASELDVDVSDLTSGVYMVEINTEDHLRQIKKLIIQ